LSASATQSRRPIFQEFDSGNLAPLKNWTKISNRLIDDLYPDKVSGQLQMTLILWIARETWGTEEKRKPSQSRNTVVLKTAWTKLSRTQICSRLKCSRQALTNAIQDAVEREIIEVHHVKRGKALVSYRYRLSPQKWPTARKYTAPKATKVEQANVETGTQLLLFPGKTSRPIPLQMTILKDGVATPANVVYHNHAGVLLGFEASCVDDQIVITVRPDSKDSEGKANRRPSGLGRENQQVVENTRPVVAESATAENYPIPAPEPPPAEDPERLIQYRNLLRPLVRERWSKELDEEFLRTIVRKAKGAPAWLYGELVQHRLKKDMRPSKHTTGILAFIAEDAAKYHERTLREAEEAARMPATSVPRPPEPLDPSKGWDRLRSGIGGRLGPIPYANWFERTRQLGEDPRTITVAVPDETTLKTIQEDYGWVIEQARAQYCENRRIVWSVEQ
jgi:hypothetical protein